MLGPNGPSMPSTRDGAPGPFDRCSGSVADGHEKSRLVTPGGCLPHSPLPRTTEVEGTIGNLRVPCKEILKLHLARSRRPAKESASKSTAPIVQLKVRIAVAPCMPG